MTTKTNVIDLTARIAQRRAEALSTPNFKILDPEGFFEIPWKDVTCFRDSANASKEDPIAFGQAGTAAVLRMYGEFGVTGWPQTWGQLMGSVAYCTELSAACNYPRINADDDATWFRAVLKVANEYSPELVPAIEAYHEKDLAALKSIFAESIGLEACSRHFDPMTGWDSKPNE
jgi:hypothetical protein